MQIIYVVEDDPDIARLVRHHLDDAGYAVRAFANSSNVLSSAQKERPALFLLDIMMPGSGGSGLDLCKKIRHSVQLSTVPIIFLTAKTSEADRVVGLELGADDYVSKPFSPRELVARVKAVLRRVEHTPEPRVFRDGDLELDTGAMTLKVRGKPVPLTATEFRLLEHFTANPGRVYTREQLLDAVWRDTSFVTARSVDVYIRRLREKIEKDAEDPRYLKTMRGAGYRFEIAK